MIKKALAKLMRKGSKPSSGGKKEMGALPGTASGGAGGSGKSGMGMKKGGMADKAGRAMKKTTADAKGRAMKKGK